MLYHIIISVTTTGKFPMYKVSRRFGGRIAGGKLPGLAQVEADPPVGDNPTADGPHTI